MRAYIFIVFDANGKILGAIDFGLRESSPDHAEICSEIKETFRNAASYKLQRDIQHGTVD